MKPMVLEFLLTQYCQPSFLVPIRHLLCPSRHSVSLSVAEHDKYDLSGLNRENKSMVQSNL